MRIGTYWWVNVLAYALCTGLQVLWVALQVDLDAHRSWWVVFFPTYIALAWYTFMLLIGTPMTGGSRLSPRKIAGYAVLPVAITVLVLLIVWLDASAPNWTTFWIAAAALALALAGITLVLALYNASRRHHGRSSSTARRGRWWLCYTVFVVLVALQALAAMIHEAAGSSAHSWYAYATPLYALYAFWIVFVVLYKTCLRRPHGAVMWFSSRQLARFAAIAVSLTALLVLLVKLAGDAGYSWSTVWIVAAALAMGYAVGFLALYILNDFRIAIQLEQGVTATVFPSDTRGTEMVSGLFSVGMYGN